MDELWDSDASENEHAGADQASTGQSNRDLLQRLVDAQPESEVGRLAAAALESLIDREASEARIAAQLEYASQQVPASMDEIVREYERVKWLDGETADPAVVAAAVAAYDDLLDSLRAEVQERLTAELATALDNVRKASLASGNPPDVAQRDVERWAEEYDALYAVEQRGDLLNQSERWAQYQSERWALDREKVALDSIARDDPGYEAAVLAAAKADFDEIVVRRMGATVGSGAFDDGAE